MKFKTTLKAMRNSYNIAVFGYCEIQDLLSNREPIAYNSGVYGWNCDFYLIDSTTVISTGYRPIGKRYLDYGRSELYNEKAKKIRNDYSLTYEERTKKLDDLFDQFCDELHKKIVESWK